MTDTDRNARRSARSRRFLATCCLALFAAVAAAQQPKPPTKPGAKPGEKPAAEAPVPAAPVREELRREVDSIALATGAKFTAVVEGKSFDLAGAVTVSQAGPLLEAAEKALDLFKQWTDASSTELVGAKKCLIVVMPSKKEFQKLGAWYEEMSKIKGTGGATQSLTYIWWNDPRAMVATFLKPYDVAAVRQVIIHEVGHLVARAYKYDYNYGPEWLEEGMAAYMEAKIAGVTSCYCFKGGYGQAGVAADKLVNLKWDKWKASVKLEAKTGGKTFRQLVMMRINDFTAAEVGKCWSMIDYLVQKDPKKFAQWMAAMRRLWPKDKVPEYLPKKGEAQEQAFKEVYGLDFAGVEAEWAQFVATKY